MVKRYLMHEMTWPEFKEAIKESIVILPVGSTEQHGFHLPLGTDTIIGTEILTRAIKKLPEDIKVIVAPSLSIGLSNEHIDFPGTLSFKNAESLISHVKQICRNLVQNGARKIVLWNCHGGNVAALRAATREVRIETGAFCVMASWWFDMTMRKLSGEVLETDVNVHAEEVETSLMLLFRPGLVEMDKTRREMPEKFMKQTYLSNMDGTPYPSWMTSDVSESGVIGDATVASKEKGKKVLEASIEGFVEFMRELQRFQL